MPSSPSRAADPAPPERPLADLVAALEPGPETVLPPDLSPVVRGIATDSSDAGPGSLFVAIRGTTTDGHDYVREAVERGAVAVVAASDHPVEAGVPTVRVPDTRAAVAALAAAWYGHPARRLRLVGITGSLGKTSTLAMLEAILLEAGARPGTVGSLGVRFGGETIRESGHTAPDPLFLHRELARLADSGCELVAMEVTSHGLVQRRVHGLLYDLGIFTNLVPLEHSEYHDGFRDYAEAKSLFFDHLRPCAPLVYDIDSPVVRRLVHEAGADPVGCGTGRAARVRVARRSIDAGRSRFELVLRRPLPRVGGGEVAPLELPLELRLLGRSNAANATLAAAAALCLGAEPGAVRRGLAGVEPQPRRIELVHDGAFTLIDDTVGHPDSISAVMEVVEELEPEALHVVFAVRGQRGALVNHHAATALAVWSRRLPLATLVVTTSEGAADERNRVVDEEREACEAALREHGVDYTLEPRLDRAVEAGLEAAGDGDVVLLLGAQGMDGGQEVARAWLSRRPDRPARRSPSAGSSGPRSSRTPGRS